MACRGILVLLVVYLGSVPNMVFECSNRSKSKSLPSVLPTPETYEKWKKFSIQLFCKIQFLVSKLLFQYWKKKYIYIKIHISLQRIRKNLFIVCSQWEFTSLSFEHSISGEVIIWYKTILYNPWPISMGHDWTQKYNK